MNDVITVAIPTLDGGALLKTVLDAVQEQRVDQTVELVVCDSGSTDDSVAIARCHGARVIEIPRARFSHGATRNLLMSESQGTHVAFLTQDAVPATPDWLARLRDAFSLADDIGLAFGPYRPRPDASAMVARELAAWFASFGHDVELVDGIRIDRLEPAARTVAAAELLGHRGFFTDANGMVSRAAWQRVPFRPVAYAEDHRLAVDMLRFGFAKAFVADAPVEHSHDYTVAGWIRRSFDEARAVKEVYGTVPGEEPRDALRNVRGGVHADLLYARSRSQPETRRSGFALARVLRDSGVHHSARATGTLLGARAVRLPARLRSLLSLERRG